MFSQTSAASERFDFPATTTEEEEEEEAAGGELPILEHSILNTKPTGKLPLHLQKQQQNESFFPTTEETPKNFPLHQNQKGDEAKKRETAAEEKFLKVKKKQEQHQRTIKNEKKSSPFVSRQSVSSEQSGDELFCLDDEGFGGARVNNGGNRVVSQFDRDDSMSTEEECVVMHHDDENDGQEREQNSSKQQQQQQQQQQNYKLPPPSNGAAEQWSATTTIQAPTTPPSLIKAQTLRDLLSRVSEFSNQSEMSVWEDALLDLKRKELSPDRFVLDVEYARHLPYRVPLVEWILDVCAEAQFGPATADVAVEYMDRVLSTVVVPKSSLQLVALCCVQVAVKYEETEELVPSLSKLRYFGSNIYSVDIIRKMELAVCVELKWSMSVVRPSHFIEAILALTSNENATTDPAIAEKIEDMSYAMYHAIVSDAEISAVRPSRLALACIFAARLRLESEGYIYNEIMLTNELKIAVGDDNWLATNELELFSRNILDRFNVEHQHYNISSNNSSDINTIMSDNGCNNATTEGDQYIYCEREGEDRLYSSQVSQYDHVNIANEQDNNLIRTNHGEEVKKKEKEGKERNGDDVADDDMMYDDENSNKEEDTRDYCCKPPVSSAPPPTDNGEGSENQSITKMRRAKDLHHMNIEMIINSNHKKLASHVTSFDSICDIISPTGPLEEFQ